MREQILKIVAKYHQVPIESLTKDTLLGPAAPIILADVSIHLFVTIYTPDVQTATVGDLFRACGEQF
jgi:hypothetical protein